MKKLMLSFFAVLFAAAVVVAQNPRNVAAVTQIQDDNTANVDQNGRLNDASLFQDGDENRSSVEQNSNEPKLTEGGERPSNVVRVSQIGDRNIQESVQNLNVAGANFLEVYQEGKRNQARFDAQTINNNDVDSEGENNHYQTQIGNDNRAKGMTAGANNIGEQTQIGDDNFSELEQRVGDKAYMFQEGDHNSAKVFQGGNDDADVSQHGNGNSAKVDQTNP